MNLGDLLSAERIRVPLRGRTVREGFGELSALLPSGDSSPSALPMDAVSASPSGHSRLLVAPKAGSPSAPAVALGVAPRPFQVEDPADASEAPGARILVLVTGRGLSREARFRIESIFFDPKIESALLRAGGASQILSLPRLTALELQKPLKVQDVMIPLSYRIYPDTPLDEVLDLMVRRRLSAVPVVGEGLQVLGVISAADILKYGMQVAAAPVGGKREGDETPTARNIMSRSIMCVTEDESLRHAAQLMANRNVAQLPVVREGEIVGFLTRGGVLTALFGGVEDEPHDRATANETIR